MKNIFRRDKRTNLEKEIDRTLERMSALDPLTEDYQKLIGYLDKLFQAKSKEPNRKISPDTLIICGVGLLEMVLMLNYEKVGVITSKALAFVLRGRV
jgi:hypothetical protein